MKLCATTPACLAPDLRSSLDENSWLSHWIVVGLPWCTCSYFRHKMFHPSGLVSALSVMGMFYSIWNFSFSCPLRGMQCVLHITILTGCWDNLACEMKWHLPLHAVMIFGGPLVASVGLIQDVCETKAGDDRNWSLPTQNNQGLYTLLKSWKAIKVGMRSRNGDRHSHFVFFSSGQFTSHTPHNTQTGQAHRVQPPKIIFLWSQISKIPWL